MAQLAYPLTDILLCTGCGGELTQRPEALACAACELEFPLLEPTLVDMRLPEEEDLETRYRENYELLANQNIDKAQVEHRHRFHEPFLSFLGPARGEKVLDVGCAQALYLRRLQASFKVGLDLALPYLKSLPPEAADLRICANAQEVRLKPGFFDLIIASDILEHVLEPEPMIQRIYEAMGPQTRFIAHVPWEEDLSIYKDSPYEFSHLRSFNDYNFAVLTANFHIRRDRVSLPKLEVPIHHRLLRWMPTWLASLWRQYYFAPGVAQAEYERRARWIDELPAREWWLLWFYPPTFRAFEMRRKQDGWLRGLARKLYYALRGAPAAPEPAVGDQA